MANPRGKPPNIVTGDPLHLTVAKGLKAYLRQLCATQLYGKNESEAAEQILNNEIRRLIISGELDTLLAKRPVGAEETAPHSEQES